MQPRLTILIVVFAAAGAHVAAQAQNDKLDVLIAGAQGRVAQDKGDYAAAAQHYSRAVQLAKAVHGEDAPETATYMNNLGTMYEALRQYAKAEPLYLRARQIWEATRGKDHPDVASALNNLAHLYKVQGFYARAEPLYQRSLQILEAKLGKDHPDVAALLSNLGGVYYSQGQYAKVEPLLQRGLEIREAKLGKDHLDVANSLNNLANLYEKQGQYARAEPLSRRALEIHEAKLGKDHPHVAFNLHTLASLLRAQGQPAQAEPLLQRALQIRETKLGKDNPDVADSLSDLARLYEGQGQYVKAEPLLQRAMQIYETKVGRDSLDLATSLNELAVVYHAQRKYAQAEPLCRRCLQIREAKLGKEHLLVATSLNNLAVMLGELRQDAKAEPLYQRALQLREAKLGKDHLDVASVLVNLANLYWARRDLDKAEPLYRRNVEIQEARLGKDHTQVAAGLDNLVAVYREQGEYAKAEPLSQRSLAIWETKLGKDHPRVVTTLGDLAGLHAAREDWSGAASAADRARRAVRRHVARTVSGLAVQDQVQYFHATDWWRWQAALSVGLLGRTDASTAGRSAAWLLNSKGLGAEVVAQRPLRERDGKAAPRPADTEPWVELDAIRQALPVDALLVELARFEVRNFAAKGSDKFWQPARYAAWVIPPAGKGDVRVLDLGEADQIDAAVAAVRKVATDKQTGDDAEKAVREPLDALAKRVLHPLLESVGECKRLLLSPDSALWLAPWSALPLPDGAYLVERCSVRLLHSGRDLVAGPGRYAKSASPLLMADPAVGEAPAAAGSAPGGKSLAEVLPVVGRLPAARAEALAVQALLSPDASAPARLFLDEQASKATFRREAVRPRVLLLGTHGYFLEDLHREAQAAAFPLTNPLLRCGLLFAGANRRGPDAEQGVLTGLDVVSADLRGTELVVLSGSETLRNQATQGDAVAGLRQAFQLAGAEAVLASLWSVDDRASADLMKRFFAGLEKEKDKAEVLSALQRELIAAQREHKDPAQPLFWAAFTLTGVPEEVLARRPAAEVPAAAPEEWLEVTATEAAVRLGEQVLIRLPRASKYRVEKTQGEWHLIAAEDTTGKVHRGYVHRDQVRLFQKPAATPH